MKCAVAVMSSSRGRSVRRSNQTVNHAGIDGFRNDTITVVDVRFSTCAFVTTSPQSGLGCGKRVDCDDVHCPDVRSQRRAPITTEEAPPWIR